MLYASVLSACGSTSNTASADQIATLQDGTSSAGSGDPTSSTVAGSGSADDAARAFSQYLRDNGLDVADIGVDANGNIDMRSAFESIDPQDPASQTAMAACRDLLGDVGFGGGGRGDIDQTAIADAFLSFSDCIRSQGFEDIPDLSFEARSGPRTR